MATPTPATLDQVRQAIAGANDFLSSEVIGKRNIAALDQLYTADARILPPGSPMISGRPAIKEFWSNLIQATNAKSLVLTSLDVIPSGDGVIEIGSARMTVAPEGQGTSEVSGKYVVVWRQEDSRWKLHVDIWNLDS